MSILESEIRSNPLLDTEVQLGVVSLKLLEGLQIIVQNALDLIQHWKGLLRDQLGVLWVVSFHLDVFSCYIHFLGVILNSEAAVVVQSVTFAFIAEAGEGILLKDCALDPGDVRGFVGF